MKKYILEKLSELVNSSAKYLSDTENIEDVEKIEKDLFGRKGDITKLSKELGSLPKEDKPVVGKALNDTKKKLSELINEAKNNKSQKENESYSELDTSLPGRNWDFGYKHPINQVIDDCIAIFRRIGFIVEDGPHIESVYHCFDALNTPKDHPSRDETDTFYFKDGSLLRTQTSTVQIRVMERNEPPIRIIAPGPCFRPDTPDATHSPNFHQIEGLYIDKNVSMVDLKSTLLYFAKELLGEEVKIRLRPHFFPFTEPSVECDFSCILCHGKGCSICKNSGWLEIAGAGMVDTNVLRNVGYDPDIWTGFAFGFGIERIAMIKHRIDDIRLFYDNDIRFIQQF